jgi:hypothetical protein
MRNPHSRPWTEEDNTKLKSLAGKMPTARIAAELGRSPGATVVQASKLKVSLSRRRHAGRLPRSDVDAAQPSSVNRPAGSRWRAF